MLLGTNIGQYHRDNSPASGLFVDTGILSPIKSEQPQKQLLVPSQIPTRRGDNSPISILQRNLINQSQMKHMIDNLLDSTDESTKYDFSQNDIEVQTNDANGDDPEDDSSEESNESSESSQESENRSSNENNSLNSQDQLSNNNVTDFNSEDAHQNHQENQ